MGRIIDRYEILSRLGRGGMATVYLARQIDLDRLVALKELGAFHLDNPDVAGRFVRESKVSGSLTHPAIVAVHAYFVADGVPYIAMEYLERGSLRPYVGRLTLAQTAGVIETVLSALSHAHGRGVVHRDLKPENVMMTRDGRVKLADFGIAKVLHDQATAARTATGMIVGTPSYMAPEQVMSREVGPWTDLYAMGVMAYELIVGRLPFPDTSDAMARLLQHINEPIISPRDVAPDLDPRLAGWIEWLLRKDPAQRPQIAAAAWDGFEDVVLAVAGPLWRRSARIAEESAPDTATEPLTPAGFSPPPAPAPEPDPPPPPPAPDPEPDPPRAPAAAPPAPPQRTPSTLRMPAKAKARPRRRPHRDQHTAQPAKPRAKRRQGRIWPSLLGFTGILAVVVIGFLNDIRSPIELTEAPSGRYLRSASAPTVRVSPDGLGEVRGFGNQRLATYLRHQGVSAGIDAKLHVYEARPGTTLRGLAASEQVRGLGTRGSAARLLPLTPVAADALLGDADFGPAVDARYLRSRNVISPGQRFYYLELPPAVRRAEISLRVDRSGKTAVLQGHMDPNDDAPVPCAGSVTVAIAGQRSDPALDGYCNFQMTVNLDAARIAEDDSARVSVTYPIRRADAVERRTQKLTVPLTEHY